MGSFEQAMEDQVERARKRTSSSRVRMQRMKMYRETKRECSCSLVVTLLKAGSLIVGDMCRDSEWQPQ